MEFFDTHCHLNLFESNEELDQIIQGARENLVNFILIPGIDIESSKKAIKISESYENILVSVGIHPNDGLKWDNQSYEELCQLAKHPNVVAIGEIGLDRHWDDCPIEKQIFILKEQLKLASEKDLPVILHSRETMKELLELITTWSKNNPSPPNLFGVFHSFEGDLEDAIKAIKLGFMIGIGGPITYKNAKIKQNIGNLLPIESILLETDTPFLAPHPFRGKKNEPKYIPHIAEKIATLRSLPINLIANQTTANAKSLFFRSNH